MIIQEQPSFVSGLLAPGDLAFVAGQPKTPVGNGRDGKAKGMAMATRRESLLVDAKESAALCGVGRTTWLTLASAGKTPASVRLGRRVLWRRDELKNWIAAGCPARQKWESINSENNS